MTEKLKVIINNEALAKLHGVKKGQHLFVTAKGGVPVNREWRNRLKDAKIDKCITVAKIEKKPTATQKKELK